MPRLRMGDEGRLVRAATAGDSQAVAALVRRYEDRAFNLALRITGSEDDAAAAAASAFTTVLTAPPTGGNADGSFAARLLAAVTDAAYERLEGLPAGARTAVGAVAGGSRPEDDALEDWQNELRAANARLPESEREALALRDLLGLPYAGVGEIVEADGDSVARLLAAARLQLSDELRGTDLAADPVPSDDCEAALGLMARRDDGELPEASEDAEWLVGHLVSCRDCRQYLDAMQYARLSYAAWEPTGPPPALLSDVLAAAREHFGERDEERGIRAAAALPIAAASGAPGSPQANGAAPPVAPPATPMSDERRRRRRREVMLVCGWAAVLLVGLVALLGGNGSDSAEGGEDASQSTLEPPPTPKATEPAPKPARKKRRPERDADEKQRVAPRPVEQAQPRVPVAAVPRRTREPTRRAPRRRTRTEPKQRRTTPPATAPAPEQEPTETPAAGGTPPAAPVVPQPQPDPATCTNPAGQSVPC